MIATNEAAVLAAAANLIAKEAKKADLKVGEYTVSETITAKITATVIKGEDEDYIPTVDIPLLDTLAIALKNSGLTRDASKAIIIDAMKAAIESKAKGSDAIAERKADIDECMKHVREITAELPSKTRKGKTRFKDAAIEIIREA